MLHRKTLRDRIATAIRDSDDAWLNEDYDAQARAVLEAVREMGYVFAPTELSTKQIRYVLAEMPFGRMEQAKYMPEMYRLFLAAARNEPYVGRSPEDTLSSAIEMIMDSDPAGAAAVLERVQLQRETQARMEGADIGELLSAVGADAHTDRRLRQQQKGHWPKENWSKKSLIDRLLLFPHRLIASRRKKGNKKKPEGPVN